MTKTKEFGLQIWTKFNGRTIYEWEKLVLSEGSDYSQITNI